MPRGALPFGFVNAFKPPGISSTSFGAWVRRRLGADAIGHWGTLDPAACGVLILALGRATRLLPLLTSDDKAYVFELRLGSATDTGDASGRVVATSAVPADWAASLPGAAASLVGDLAQTPPMYSAVKIGGRPLYKDARAGRTVDRPERTIRIFDLRVLGTNGISARMAVECSAGTYVRTLCEQIGERLGAHAHMSFLLRTRAGPFSLAESRTPAQISAEGAAAVIDPLDILPMPCIDLDDARATRFINGNPVWSTADVAQDHHERLDVLECSGRPSRSTGTGLAVGADADIVLALHKGALIGVARRDADLIVPVRVLARNGENR